MHIDWCVGERHNTEGSVIRLCVEVHDLHSLHIGGDYGVQYGKIVLLKKGVKRD